MHNNQANMLFNEVTALMGKLANQDTRTELENMQAAIGYLVEKLHIVTEKLKAATGRKTIELGDDDRRRLAQKAHALNEHLLATIEDTWMPETLTDWYRRLIAEKYNSYRDGVKKRGRPKTPVAVIDLIIRFARENPSWGCERMASQLRNLGYQVSERTVRRILQEQGLLPSDWDRKGDWQRFFDAHRDVLAATDFLTYELLTPHGLVREHVLFFENVTSREVWCGGIAHNPNGNWMAQVARNQTDAIDGKLNGMKYLIHDRDPLFQGRFDRYIEDSGCGIKRLPPHSPELNGYMESFIKTIKQECLDHLILTSEAQLRYVVNEYLEYYNHERPHSGLGGAMIAPRPQDTDGEIVMFQRLGGLLKSYRRIRRKAA